MTVSSALQLDSAQEYARAVEQADRAIGDEERHALAGIGSLGSVTSVGGRIEPGPSGSAVGGLGTLTFASLTLDLSSAVGIDLAGTGTTLHDHLVVTGQAHFAGNLTLREQPPFVSGSCGQVIPVILDGSSIPFRGSFGSLAGAAPGPAAAGGSTIRPGRCRSLAMIRPCRCRVPRGPHRRRRGRGNELQPVPQERTACAGECGVGLGRWAAHSDDTARLPRRLLGTAQVGLSECGK